MTNEINLDTFAGKIIFSVVRIESIKDGESEPATGFIVSEEIEKNASVPILITNKHVIEKADKIIFYFIKSDGKKPILGKKVRIVMENPKSHFISHPNKDIDLVAFPIAPLLRRLKKPDYYPFYIPIPTSIIATREDLSKFDVIEEIIFIGYPNGIYDTVNLTPLVRKGITATPLSLFFKGKPTFLIDSMAFTGSSGSPVFIYNKGMYSDISGNTSIGSRLVFVGVVSEFHVSEEYLSERDISISTPLNLGEVVGSDKVKELIKVVVDKNNPNTKKSPESDKKTEIN